MIALACKLAYRNLMGAGLRTWLNVGVLSFAFVIIIFHNGMIDGWNVQARRDTIDWEYGFGHLFHEDYDPFTLQDGHGVLENAGAQDLTPILIQQGTLYPKGRMIPAILKGIPADQDVLKLPTGAFSGSNEEIPAIIGKRMALATKLDIGDQVLLRWRDKHGTFDATNITIVEIFNNNVPTVDNGQIWIPLRKIWEMTGLEGHATLHVAGEGYTHKEVAGWRFEDQNSLLAELDRMIAMKRVGGSVMYLMLLALALLALFDTQVLSVFRRQREIGTYVALGMTRMQVVLLFSVEGAMNSVLATIAGCLYGIPIFLYFARAGIGMPATADEVGISIAERIFPVYGAGLIFGTVCLVVISATIVSFFPARKISKMDPVDALKGKLQ